MVGWLVVFYVPSTARSFTHLLSLEKDVKLGFYTFPTRNRTPGRRVAVHYTTTVPRQLPMEDENIIDGGGMIHRGVMHITGCEMCFLHMLCSLISINRNSCLFSFSLIYVILMTWFVNMSHMHCCHFVDITIFLISDSTSSFRLML